MKTPDEYAKVKKSFLKEFSRIRQLKRREALNKIVNISSLQELPEIKVLKDRLRNTDKTKPGSFETPHKSALRTITQCLIPPFQEALGNTISHPKTLFNPHQEITEVINPYNFIDPVLGEMSLSVISGQNDHDFYGGGDPFQFNGPIEGFNQQISCGIISQQINITPYDYDTYVELNIEIEFPPVNADITKFKPGGRSSFLGGLLFVQGYLDIYTGALVDRDFLTTGISDQFLLGSMDGYSTTPFLEYHPEGNYTYGFRLAARQSQFWVHVSAQIGACSTIGNIPESAVPGVVDYALIDFRKDNSVTILRDNENGGNDHPAPGCIRIKKLCYSIEPNYRKEPDTN